MSTHSDDDEDYSQDGDEDNMYQQADDEYDAQQANAFVTDDADLHVTSEHQLGTFEDVEPIEARPPHEIDVDEQERHQSGTPAFRTLDDVCFSSMMITFSFSSLSFSYSKTVYLPVLKWHYSNRNILTYRML